MELETSTGLIQQLTDQVCRKSTQTKLPEQCYQLTRTRVDIFKALHPTPAERTFFSSSHGIFTEIDHILGYKTQLDKFNAIVITQSMFIDDNGVKLEIRKLTEN